MPPSSPTKKGSIPSKITGVFGTEEFLSGYNRSSTVICVSRSIVHYIDVTSYAEMVKVGFMQRVPFLANQSADACATISFQVTDFFLNEPRALSEDFRNAERTGM